VFVFQQDNAPARCARDTVDFLRSETPQFISPDMWPANSPDLNPVNYRIWGMLQERVYRVPIRDTEKLRKHLVATWAGFQQSMLDDAVDQWHKRLDACIRAEGSHFLANVNSRSRSLYAIARPSVVCLSSVTLVRPTQAVQIFRNISTAFGTLAIR